VVRAGDRIDGLAVGQIVQGFHLELRIAGGAGFHPSGGLDAITLLDHVLEAIFQVRWPVDPRAIIEDEPIDLALWGHL
jgi:hypothetical protein